ncbi:WD repeat-containing protein 93 [Hypomesus transpacificus]|uniref:WD repeat-containing protein 93 n=1 Tax=Hypomesus transpacificus TaxID=137520 RepID=UPI001F07F0B4|nr:WD repeat-containing protein 93 [Hypomesus transpacificus]
MQISVPRMPVYIRKCRVDIPGPQENGQGADDEYESYMRDPDQLRDQLPQPFRMIDKVLSRLIDSAWDTISERENIKIAEQSKRNIPVVELSDHLKLPVRTNCLTCSEDGRYIFMGHSQGLSVSSSPSLICVSAWLEDRVEITSLHIACLGEMTYLLGALDDMGVARLFAFQAESIHLIKVINETEDFNQRNVCSNFELSKRGDFGSASMSCHGAHWLEVYRFPKESWLKELEMLPVALQKQLPPGTGDIKLSPIVMLMKIKPPKTQSGSTLKSPLEVLQKTDDGTVIGSGQNHLISSCQWDDQEAIFKSMYRKYLITNPSKTKDTEEKTSHCTSHFLLPGGLFPVHGGTKPLSGLPVAVCMWWTGSHNLLQYFLCKAPKDKPDMEHKPDVLWPNAQEIFCSTVSSCTNYIALGLDTELVTVWDRYSGLPLPILSVSADSAFSRMLFVDYRHVSSEETLHCQGQTQCKIHLLVTCKSGACHILTTGSGMESHATQLTERPADPRTLPTVTESVPFLLGLVCFMHNNGTISLQDVIRKTTVCFISLPATHLLATPWSPIFTLDSVHQTLFIRGDQQPSENGCTEGKDSSLFACHFHQLAIVEAYRMDIRDHLKVQRRERFTDLENGCNLYFQQRVQSLDERNKAMTHTWNQLQQHACLPSTYSNAL